MKKKASTCLPVPLAEDPKSSSVLSEFKVDNHQFFVIRLENNLEANPLTEGAIEQFTTYIEMDRFEAQGQIYIIVKAEQPVNPPELDLTILLTGRELQIAMLVAAGQVNKKIARQLHISEWTVATHLRRIFTKLGVDSRAAMVYRCAPMIQKWVETTEGSILMGTLSRNDSSHQRA